MPSAAELQAAVIQELDVLRELKSLGVREFCGLANIGTSTWYDYRALKTSPPLDDLCRMAEAVGSSLDVGVIRYDAASPSSEGRTMRALSSLEAREVALLMERMSPEQREYLLGVARAVALPRSPTRDT